jgi:hypothetical protein
LGGKADRLLLGGEDAIGQSSLIGNFAQNGNGTTYLTVNYVNDTQSFGEYDTLNVIGGKHLDMNSRKSYL